MKVVEDNTANSSKSVPDQLMDMAATTVKKWKIVRDRSDNWMAKQYVSDTYIADELGDGPEDHDHAERKVMITPLGEGQWLEPGVASIVKALSVHPDTRDIDMHKKICIAASIIYRHGEPERDSTEASATLNFAEAELAHMATEIGEIATKAKLYSSIQLWTTIGQRRGFNTWKVAIWPEEAKLVASSNNPAQEEALVSKPLAPQFESLPAAATFADVQPSPGAELQEGGAVRIPMATGLFEFSDLFNGCSHSASQNPPPPAATTPEVPNIVSKRDSDDA